MNDSLASYWNTPVSLDALDSLCRRERAATGKQSACRSIAWGQGNTLKMEDTRQRGNRRNWNIPLVDTFGYIFPETSQDCKPFIDTTGSVADRGCGYAAVMDSDG